MFRCTLLAACLALSGAPQNESASTRLAVRRVVGLSYPRLAQLAAVQGEVELIATISRDGKVTRTRVLSGSGLLAPAAQEALSRWRFAGCTAASDECEAKVRFSFVLHGHCVLPNCPTEFQVDLPGNVEVKSALPRAIVN